ncbi:MAG: pilus assembly protein PilM [Deltaproteobacteria bacterium]|nr:pilus assembly protein PilM [Deltaproteobacteria bacterium]
MFARKRRAGGITVCIETSARELRVVRARGEAHPGIIEGYERRSLPPEGDPARQKALVEYIRELAGFISAGNPDVRLIVDTPGVLLRNLVLPSMPRGEIASTVRLQWPRIAQVSFDEMSVDLHSTRSRNPRSPGLNVLVAGISSRELDAVLAPFRDGGVHINAAVPGPVALAMLRRSEIEQAGGEPSLEAILDIGLLRSCLVLVRGEEVHAAREFPTAGQTFTQTVSRELDVPLDQAEKLKREYGLAVFSEDELSAEVASELRSIHGALRPVLERLSAEVQRSIAFVQEDRGEQRPQRLLLTGGGAALPGLAETMADFLDIPVEIWEPAERLDLKMPGGSSGEAAEGSATGIEAMCLGGAAGRPPVNLLEPSGAATGHSVFRTGPLAFVGTYVLVLAALVGWFGIEKSRIENKVAAQERQLALIPAAERSALELGPYLQARARESVDWKRLFEELYWLVPEEVSLESMTLKRPSSTAGDAPRTPRVLEIEGIASGAVIAAERTLAVLLEAIEGSPIIKNVQIVRSAGAKDPDARGLRFAFVCEVDEAGMAGARAAEDSMEEEDAR